MGAVPRIKRRGITVWIGGNDTVNDLERYFNNNTGRPIQKWQHYFNIYDRHFSRFRDTEVNVVEIGVCGGGSLQMWKDYFGPSAKIYGVDIDPKCKGLEEENVEIFIGDQANRGFLESLTVKIPRVDILIDDGGHMMEQQINTFEVLFPHIDKNGIYLCEDLHTSYWKRFGGGYNKRTFVEYSKEFIDRIHGWHFRDVTKFTESVDSLHYYDSILVIEKKPREKPTKARVA